MIDAQCNGRATFQEDGFFFFLYQWRIGSTEGLPDTFISLYVKALSSVREVLLPGARHRTTAGAHVAKGPGQNNRRNIHRTDKVCSSYLTPVNVRVPAKLHVRVKRMTVKARSGIRSLLCRVWRGQTLIECYFFFFSSSIFCCLLSFFVSPYNTAILSYFFSLFLFFHYSSGQPSYHTQCSSKLGEDGCLN